MKKENIGVYRIRNVSTNRCYVGSSQRLNLRKRRHFSELRANKHKNKNLQYDFNISEPSVFIFEVLEYCQVENLVKLEQQYLDETMCYLPIFGYNINSTATRNTPTMMSVETRKKKSLANKNRKQVINKTTGEIFVSQREAARSINVDKNEIKRVCNGIRGRRTCKGYCFEYYIG